MNPESPERHFEATLFEMQRQYNQTRDALASDGCFGNVFDRLKADPTLENPYIITGIDGKEYPLPSFTHIKAEIHKNQETKDFYLEQFHRGFTHLHITPFALSIDQHMAILKATILAEYKKNGGHIYSATPDILHTTLAQLQAMQDQEFPLNPDDPLYQWDQYTNADTTGDLVYFPTSFDKTNHGGKTKQQILDAQTTAGSPFAGYQVSLLHPHLHIPRTGNTPNTHILAAGQSPREYLTTLTEAKQDRKHLQYAQRGQTIEEALTLVTTILQKHHQLLDDYGRGGSFHYALGSYFPRSGYVPCAYAIRVGGRFNVDGFDPGRRDSGYGFRSAVGIG